jgi:Lipocalin-like domain
MAASKLERMVEANPLLGTWKLKAYVVMTAEGEGPTPYGPSPTGYLSYSADSRMQVIAAARDRSLPIGEVPLESERAALYDTMFAYAGRYSVRGDQVIHHVEVSWNEAWTGTDQIRRFEVRGNTLTLSTRIADPISGVESYYALLWEKLAAKPQSSR